MSNETFSKQHLPKENKTTTTTTTTKKKNMIYSVFFGQVKE